MCKQSDHNDQNQGFPVSLGSETAIVLGQFLNSPINKDEQTVKEPDSRANYYYQVLVKQLNYFQFLLFEPSLCPAAFSAVRLSVKSIFLHQARSL